MEKGIVVLLVLVGLINFAPVLGVLSADRVAQAYAVDVSGRDLEVLLRHRALLFGIVGGFILCSVFLPAMRLPAMVMGGASMAGFLRRLRGESLKAVRAGGVTGAPRQRRSGVVSSAPG